jgi:uncharacterized membrane protein YcaP (DUF421 family)
MKRNAVSERDLFENLRLGTHLETLDQVKMARMERSGDISFILKDESGSTTARQGG